MKYDKNKVEDYRLNQLQFNVAKKPYFKENNLSRKESTIINKPHYLIIYYY